MIAHPELKTQDLPELPQKLQDALEIVYRRILSIDPYRCKAIKGIRSHDLRRRELDGCRAIDIELLGVHYRLVYLINDSDLPKDKRVNILSFALHDTAYDRATDRIKASVKYNRHRR